MDEVARLFIVDDVEIDPSCMRQLVRDRGMRIAEGIVSRAMDEIATRLTHIEATFAAGDFVEVERSAKKLSAIAEETGLVTVSLCAIDLAGLVKRHDSAALAAVLSRLVRVGEVSLVLAWDTHDASV